VLAIGGLLVCAAVLTLAAIAPLFRSDPPPKWTTYGWVGEAVTLTIVWALALGIASIGAGVVDAVQTGLDPLDLVLLAAVVVVAFALRRWWKSRVRPGAPQAAPDLSIAVSDSKDTSGRAPAAPAEAALVSPSSPSPPHRAA
jgi:hypothetical protein